MIIPNRLKIGDMVGLTAPASPTSLKVLHESIQSIQKLGLRVKVGATCYLEENNYTSAPAQDRAAELMNMFADHEIKAIFCLRGGYGSAQILPFLDYTYIQNQPKWLIGYSDITALHIALQQNSHLATIHGAMPASELITGDPFTIASLKQCLFTNGQTSIINPKNEHIYTYFHHMIQAPITGGNLSVITSLLGTPYEINTKGKILLIEEVAEPLYKIDRMLTQLMMAEKIKQSAAIIFGSFTKCESKDGEITLQEIIQKKILPSQKKCLYNVRTGHCLPKVSIKLGQITTLIV